MNCVLTVDVPITVNIPCSNKVLQKASITRTRNVLGWNFHWTEFIEFIVFDVLVKDNDFTSTSDMQGEIYEQGTGSRRWREELADSR